MTFTLSILVPIAGLIGYLIGKCRGDEPAYLRGLRRGYQRGLEDGFWIRTQAVTEGFTSGQELDLMKRMEAVRPLAEAEAKERV